MNREILIELKAYIEGHRAEKQQVLMKEQQFFRQELPIPRFAINADKKHKELSEKISHDISDIESDGISDEISDESNHLDLSAFRRDSCQLEQQFESEPSSCYTGSAPKEEDLEDYIRKQKSKDTFSTKLLQYIDLTGLADSEIYKRAGMDRKHFSKIRCDRDYRPKKATALALCLALRLDEERTGELLKLAGYSLTNSDTGDLVVKFCIERGIYDLTEVNEALVYFGQRAIGVIGF